MTLPGHCARQAAQTAQKSRLLSRKSWDIFDEMSQLFCHSSPLFFVRTARLSSVCHSALFRNFAVKAVHCAPARHASSPLHFLYKHYSTCPISTHLSLQTHGRPARSHRQLTQGLRNGEEAQVFARRDHPTEHTSLASSRNQAPPHSFRTTKRWPPALHRDEGFSPTTQWEYYVSYYDYYQPKPTSPRPTRTSKKIWPSTTTSTSSDSPPPPRSYSGRKDVVVVSSVSCHLQYG